jgi:hypothetical protein
LDFHRQNKLKPFLLSVQNTHLKLACPVRFPVALVTTPNWELLRSREVGRAQVLLFQASNISMRKSSEAFSRTRNDREIEKFCRTVRADRASPLYLGASALAEFVFWVSIVQCHT